MSDPAPSCWRCGALRSSEVDERTCAQCDAPTTIGERSGRWRFTHALSHAPLVHRARALHHEEFVDIEIANLGKNSTWDGVARFEQTAKALIDLARQPNTRRAGLPRAIALVHHESGGVFFVHERVADQTLAMRCERARMGDDEAQWLLRALLEATTALHALGPSICHGAIDEHHVAVLSGEAVLFGFHSSIDQPTAPMQTDDVRNIAQTVRACSIDMSEDLRALLDRMHGGGLGSAKEALARLTAIQNARARKRGPSKQTRTMLLAAAVLAVASLVVGFTLYRSDRAPIQWRGHASAMAFSGGKTCRLQTMPAGAEVFVLDERTISDDAPPREASLGKTPLTVSQPATGTLSLLVRKDRHRSTVIAVAADLEKASTDCDLALRLLPSP